MADFGFKISKEGESTNSTEDYKYSLNSKYRNLTIFMSGVVTIKNTSNVAVINHNLGYVPIYLVFVQAGTNYYPLPNSFGYSGSTYHPECWSDTTSLTVNLNRGNSADHDVKYLIFNERLV